MATSTYQDSLVVLVDDVSKDGATLWVGKVTTNRYGVSMTLPRPVSVAGEVSMGLDLQGLITLRDRIDTYIKSEYEQMTDRSRPLYDKVWR